MKLFTYFIIYSRTHFICSSLHCKSLLPPTTYIHRHNLLY